MPLEIEERWEYWTPSDEMREAFAEEGGKPTFDSLFDDRLYKTRCLGLRFGRGDPDAFFPRESPRRRVEEREVVRHRPCKKCGVWFLPERRDRAYCSVKCVPHPGRERERPDEARCVQCRKPFLPGDKDQRFCSVRCAGLRGATARRVVKVAEGGCPVCGNPIPPEGRGDRMYCSKRCMKIQTRRTYAAKHKKEKTVGSTS